MLDGRTLRYYADERMKNMKGELVLNETANVVICEQKARDFCFQIEAQMDGKDKKMYLSCDSQQDREDWCELFQSAVQNAPALVIEEEEDEDGEATVVDDVGAEVAQNSEELKAERKRQELAAFNQLVLDCISTGVRRSTAIAGPPMTKDELTAAHLNRYVARVVDMHCL